MKLINLMKKSTFEIMSALLNKFGYLIVKFVRYGRSKQ